MAYVSLDDSEVCFSTILHAVDRLSHVVKFPATKLTLDAVDDTFDVGIKIQVGF